MTTILGLSAGWHDSAVAVVRDGHILLAAQEERFSRRRHDAAFPARALAWAVAEAGLTAAAVDAVAVHAPAALHAGIPEAVRAALPGLAADRLTFGEAEAHHAAAAFFPSPFSSAAVLVAGGGPAAIALGDGNRLTPLHRMPSPQGVGFLYSAFTYYTGFRVNSGEYKVMGLAPYGRPVHVRTILDHLVRLDPDGAIHLNRACFDATPGAVPVTPAFCAVMGGPARAPETPLTQRDMDLAASIQAVAEEAMLRLARTALARGGRRHLCLGGGMALNCVANGRIRREVEGLDGLWIQPAAGEAGGALGAALALWHHGFGGARPDHAAAPGGDGMGGALLGPSFAADDVARRLSAAGCRFQRLPQDALLDRVARALAARQAVGWMQGRAEFGPRALGGRSILGDPRSPGMQRLLNLKIKFRESFRPFAPSVRREVAGDWFTLAVDSPYMVLVAPVHPSRLRALSPAEAAISGLARLDVARSDIPAVTHVDGSARVQTVDAATHPLYHALLRRFETLTGCPVLVNTSFNVRGEPMVLTPEDAFACFMGTGLDLLVAEDCLVVKSDQDPALARDYRAAFAPD